MLGRQTCIACGRLSPETNGDTTLTTSYGWRIRKGVGADGGAAVEWRCPTCWQKFKAAQSSAPPPVPPRPGQDRKN
jgi:hypothetical protein